MKTSLFALLLSLAAGAGSLQAAAVYNFNVNTSAIAGQTGIIDFQFNAGNLDVDAAVASISGFSTNGSLTGSSATDGTVTPVNAQLPGNFGILNDTTQALNDLFQSMTFGTSIHFTLTLSGAAVDNPNASNLSGSTFAFSLYQPAFAGTFLTSSPDGAVAELQLNPGGSVTPQTFPTDTGGPAVATISTATPEPGTMMLLGAGLIAVGVLRRRTRS